LRRPDGFVTLAAVDPEPGEQVFFHGHPSWRGILSFYIRGFIIAVIAGVLAGAITAIASSGVKVEWIVVAVVVVFALVLLIGFIRRVSTVYTITNQRLTIRTGILRREVHQTRLERIQNVNSTQTVADRILRVGKVDFDTAAEAGYSFSFIGVASPQEIVRTVDRAIHDFGHTQPGLQPQSDV
jgi:uncharacterized membrane protein YdbT with pleckstrin-like domain